MSRNGQVTIPKRLRDHLALAPGIELDFSEEIGMLVARGAIGREPLGGLVGLLPRYAPPPPPGERAR